MKSSTTYNKNVKGVNRVPNDVLLAMEWLAILNKMNATLALAHPSQDSKQRNTMPYSYSSPILNIVIKKQKVATA